MSPRPFSSAASTWCSGSARNRHCVLRIKWDSQCCRQLCMTSHFTCGDSGSAVSFAICTRVAAQRRETCAQKCSSSNTTPHHASHPQQRTRKHVRKCHTYALQPPNSHITASTQPRTPSRVSSPLTLNPYGAPHGLWHTAPSPPGQALPTSPPVANDSGATCNEHL